ncbi:MAG: DUF3072 domain-containing protein [Ginsengibacter sp.]
MTDKNARYDQEQVNKNHSQVINDHPVAGSNTIKDPEDWSTGDEPMTGA